MKELEAIFNRLDSDGSGHLTRDEIESIDEPDKEEINDLFAVSDPLLIFDALDTDGSGKISISEFCDGIWQVAVSNAPIELKRVEKQVDHIRRDVHITQDLVTQFLADFKIPRSTDVRSFKEAKPKETLQAEPKAVGTGPELHTDSLKASLLREAEVIYARVVEALDQVHEEYLARESEGLKKDLRKVPESAGRLSGSHDGQPPESTWTVMGNTPVWARELTWELQMLRKGGMWNPSEPPVPKSQTGPQVQSIGVEVCDTRGSVASERCSTATVATERMSMNSVASERCSINSFIAQVMHDSVQHSPKSNTARSTRASTTAADSPFGLSPESTTEREAEARTRPKEICRQGQLPDSSRTSLLCSSPRMPPPSRQPIFPHHDGLVALAIPPPGNSEVALAAPTSDAPDQKSASRWSDTSFTSRGSAKPPQDVGGPMPMHTSADPTLFLADTAV